ncbi:Methyltransf_16 domain-containing protein [Cephalotus follicularis]|uniref:Methyltransf_16 domain-containing protein n=1 Tax=Cephalotus follicularis TaxID=3775 RepID=A0A1Q3B9G3_CEPFO|nr:Methyltransf_16 domain-containing protein [Cephalotus follicularis]
MNAEDSAIDDEKERRLVMSEVHLGCPPGISGPHISHFTVSIPSDSKSNRFSGLFKDEAAPMHRTICVDEDGDLVLTRRNSTTHNCRITVQHNITSSISCVGLQLWKAELLLSDFVLHKMFTSSVLDGIISLELGAGTGLVGILLACVAKTVFLTDRDEEILDNCAINVQLNSGVVNYQAAIHVRELDWMNFWPPKVIVETSSSQRWYSWTSSEIEEAQRASLLLAADVIYSDNLTDSFFHMLERLMSVGANKVLYLALEKRYNFSLDDHDVVANGYSRFRSYFAEEGDSEAFDPESSPSFVGKRVDLTIIPQYMEEYDRGSDVELWEIKYKRRRHELGDSSQQYC